jgi:hypothetical protein
MAGEIEQLAELATERAQHMERIQVIDDEASGLLTNLDNDRNTARKVWGHLLPRDELAAAATPVDLRPIPPPGTSPYFDNLAQFPA